MIDQAKSALKTVLRPAANAMTAFQPRILMYHRFSAGPESRAVAADLLHRQIELLKKKFTLLTMRDLVRRSLSAGEPGRHFAAITVDDGYEDFYSHAFPVLREHGVPATIFVVGGFVSRELWLWPDVLRAVIAAAEPGRYGLRGFWRDESVAWRNSGEREEAWSALADRLLTESTETRYDAIQSLAESVDVDVESLDMREYTALSWDQLRELRDAGIEIGDHTWSHCNVARQSKAALTRELNRSRKAIEEHVGCTVSGLAYPNGMPADYSAEAAQTVAELGYEYAVVAHPRRFRTDSVYSIGRLDGAREMRRFRNAIAGFRLLRFGSRDEYRPGKT